MAVAKDLHFDMAGACDPLFQQNFVVGEAGLGLAPTTFERRFEVLGLVDLAHALAATARDRLYQHGIADGIGLLLEALDRLILALIAGRHRHARLAHQLLGGVLEAHRLDARRLRADPDEVSVDDSLREARILRQESVAGMDRFGAGLLGGGDDFLAYQIALRGGGGADMHCLVGAAHVERLGIGIRIDCDGGDPHLTRGADDAAGDFAAIGDKELLDHAGAANPFFKSLRAADEAIYRQLCRQSSLLDDGVPRRPRRPARNDCCGALTTRRQGGNRGGSRGSALAGRSGGSRPPHRKRR